MINQQVWSYSQRAFSFIFLMTLPATGLVNGSCRRCCADPQPLVSEHSKRVGVLSTQSHFLFFISRWPHNKKTQSVKNEATFNTRMSRAFSILYLWTDWFGAMNDWFGRLGGFIPALRTLTVQLKLHKNIKTHDVLQKRIKNNAE